MGCSDRLVVSWIDPPLCWMHGLVWLVVCRTTSLVGSTIACMHAALQRSAVLGWGGCGAPSIAWSGILLLYACVLAWARGQASQPASWLYVSVCAGVSCWCSCTSACGLAKSCMLPSAAAKHGGGHKTIPVGRLRSAHGVGCAVHSAGVWDCIGPRCAKRQQQHSSASGKSRV